MYICFEKVMVWRALGKNISKVWHRSSTKISLVVGCNTQL